MTKKKADKKSSITGPVYTHSITKLPEQGFIEAADYWIIPCSNKHSVLQVYNDFFTILNILYNRPQIKKEMLEHIRVYFTFYKQITYAILSRKKLHLADWLATMANKPLPADEICLTACTIMLNIHVSVDYLTGTWTTFELPTTDHDYIIENSDIHLIYRGACTYNLLCKQQDLKTKGRKLLDYKLYRTDLTKPVRIELKRIDEYPTHPQHDGESDDTELYYHEEKIAHQNESDTDATEIYDHVNVVASKVLQGNAIDIIESYEMMNLNTENLKQSKSTSQKPTRCIKRKKTTIAEGKSKHITENKKQSFKCKSKNCSIKVETRKDLYQHYKATHKRAHRCKRCDKKYKTPYSLEQHNYIHRSPHRMFTCKKCNRIFAFKSQLIIHRSKHLNQGKYECTECFTTFKYKHDMFRHRREHNAKMLKCGKCEYIGSALNLKEHARQHNKKARKICPLCKKSFTFRMELWRHKQHCYRSDSPEF